MRRWAWSRRARRKPRGRCEPRLSAPSGWYSGAQDSECIARRIRREYPSSPADGGDRVRFKDAAWPPGLVSSSMGDGRLVVEVELMGRVVPIQVFPQGIGMGEFSEELLRALAFSHRRNEKLLSLIQQVYKVSKIGVGEIRRCIEYLSIFAILRSNDS
jgi:hypothetical protein